MSAQGSVLPAPWRAELGRLARFCVVGASNTLITLGSYALLLLAGCPAEAASAVAFALGALNGYHWNARWTFAVRGALWRYVGVQGLGAGLSAAGVAAARGQGVARLTAEVVILPAVTLITYCLSRRFVFSSPAA
jgi:putative flippase GtrA